MTISIEAVDTVLTPLRQGFQADGADLQVTEATDDVVKVSLIVTDDTCHECILPGAVLSSILESTVRDTFPEINRFEFADPRD